MQFLTKDLTAENVKFAFQLQRFILAILNAQKSAKFGQSILQNELIWAKLQILAIFRRQNYYFLQFLLAKQVKLAILGGKTATLGNFK